MTGLAEARRRAGREARLDHGKSWSGGEVVF